MNFSKTAIAFIIIFILLLIYYQTRYKHIYVGEHKWNVISSYSDCKDAAALMAQANAKMMILFDHLRKKYHIDETEQEIATECHDHINALMTPNDIRNMAGVLITNYNPDEFYETDPRYTIDTSYTVDKGAQTYLCLRNKQYPHKLIDLNTVLFTMIHESAHMANYKYWGHLTDFWCIFKWLLRESVEADIYQPIDYSKHPVEFCGLHVAYSPLYDNTLPNIWDFNIPSLHLS